MLLPFNYLVLLSFRSWFLFVIIVAGAVGQRTGLSTCLSTGLSTIGVKSKQSSAKLTCFYFFAWQVCSQF